MKKAVIITLMAAYSGRIGEAAPAPPGGIHAYGHNVDERLEEMRQHYARERLERSNTRDQEQGDVELSCGLKKCTFEAYPTAAGTLSWDPRTVERDGQTFVTFDTNGDHTEFDTRIDYGFFGGVDSFAGIKINTNDETPVGLQHVQLKAEGKGTVGTSEAFVTCEWKNTKCNFKAEPKIVRGPKRIIVQYPVLLTTGPGSITAPPEFPNSESILNALGNKRGINQKIINLEGVRGVVANPRADPTIAAAARKQQDRMML
eukprot:GHVU01207590.1.p1 GENE.GHVU01207590.1~~GHVU01207590.1.p1  ORF type:complete len:292 (+),score=40.64 GHVU01207590.1:100-876(+)